MGIFYLQSVTQIAPNKYALYATSAVGLLIRRRHRGGLYTGQTVAEVLPEIFGPVPYSIKSNLAGIKLYGWLPYVKPPDASARDNPVSYTHLDVYKRQTLTSPPTPPRLPTTVT